MSPKEKSKVAVFGGSGFLGSHVADCLSEEGHQVTVFDRQPSPYLRRDQEMVVGDILDPKMVERVIEGSRYLYHFAGIADLDDAGIRPLETVKQNIEGTAILLDAAVKKGIERFIYSSTIYVYSQLGGFYKCSKQAAELYIEEYQKKYRLNYTILRYGTLYGIRANNHNSIYRYIRQALSDQKIICQGTGEESREYINVRDAAQLSAKILSKEHENKHVIITGHHPMKFKEMIAMIREMLENRVEVIFEKGENSNHYSLTPYSFVPKIGQKLVSSTYTDMGQGLLECIQEIYKSLDHHDYPKQSRGLVKP